MTTSTHTLANGVIITEVETTVTYAGRGEFYSNIKTGDVVTLITRTASGGPLESDVVSRSIRGEGASLAIYRLADVDLA